MTSENFEKHVLFDRLNSLQEILSNDDIKKKLNIEKISYFQTVYSFITQRINSTIPDLIQLAEMDSLSSELNEGINQINNFVGNDNEGHLSNAINSFNAAINKIKSFPISISENDFDFSRKIASFESTVLGKYKSLEEEKNELKSEIDDLNAELVLNKANVQNLIELIKGKDTEIEGLNSTFKTDFDNLKSQHQQQFSNSLEVYRSEIDKSKEQFRQEIEELKSKIDTDTSELVTRLNAKHDEAKTLVSLIGNVGVTGNYQNIANSHKQSADFWRWAAVIFMTLFSILLIWTIIDLSSESFDWAKSLIRLIAAVALSYPATYAARESSKHRKLETKNRNAELELASINPFIEGLEDEEKQKIKAKLVEKYFGNHNNFESLSIDDTEGLSMKALDKILDTIAKIKK